MKELHQMILSQGISMSGGILRVDSFLNHRIDTGLITRMGQAFYEAFRKKPVDLILTAESSGIAIALSTAQAFSNIPVVFAKKGIAANMEDRAYKSRLYSYTRGMETVIRVSKDYLPKGARVLIIDDFLANGEAAHALIDIVQQAGAQVVGIGICIEKAFQSGGAALRSAGYKVVALASITAIHEGKPVLLTKG